MNLLNKLILAIFLSTASIYPTNAWTTAAVNEVSSTATQTSWEEVVDYAKANLPTVGQLVIKPGGFVYLKVDDEYIHTLFPMLGLEAEGYKEPPYFRASNAPGAHISIFYEDENIVPDEEEGMFFHFELKQIVIVKPSRTASYAVLQVESPDLELLRKKYGLSPKLFGHEYHISIAKKTIR